MNRGMRLQNYQRTFLRVNTPPPPPPHLTISFLQLSFPLPSSPSSPPPPFFAVPIWKCPDESVRGSKRPVHDAQRDYELSKPFVKGIVRRKMVVTRCNIVSCPPYPEGGKMSFRRGSNPRRCVRYIFLSFFYYLSRLSSLED